jgi:GT2 family glycosyltransferase
MKTVVRVLALVVDFRTTPEAARLACQVARAPHPGIDLTVAHVDNGNNPPVALTEDERRHGVRKVRIPSNGGYGSGLRAAIDLADAHGEQYDAYWLLNSDLEVEPDTLTRLIALLRANQAIGAVGPTVYWGRTTRIWGARGVVSPLLGTTRMTAWPQGGELPRWSYIPGCSMLVRSEAYHAVGGMPDRYGMYYEETELSMKLQKAGWSLHVEPAAKVYHGVDSRKRGVPARHHAFFFTRNNLYFWKRNFSIPPLLQLPRTLGVVFKDVVIPLRHASGPAEALDRLRFIGMGLRDAFPFLRYRHTPYERRHFDLRSPEEEGGENA